MGCDIHTFAIKDNKVVECLQPFDWRSYAMYGWMVNVCNYSNVTPLSQPRTWIDLHPEIIESIEYTCRYYGDHSHSWLTVAELNAIDYDQEIVDYRGTVEVSPGFYDGSATLDKGKTLTLREFLGTRFFEDLDILNKVGIDMVVFAFDN